MTDPISRSLALPAGMVEDAVRRAVARQRAHDIIGGFLISTVVGSVLFAWMRRLAARRSG